MKIGITGHTSGFGKTFVKMCDTRNIEWIGFSRTNGYDITNPDDRKRIVEMVEDCDVFINNAQSEFAQIAMLYDVYNAWAGLSKRIISLGSYASNAAEWRLAPCLYSTAKQALDTTTYQLVNSHCRGALRVGVIKPGYMGREHPLTFEAVGEHLFHMMLSENELTEMVIKS